MASVFSKIVRGEIPAHIVAQDDHHLAFLDITPLVSGHTLVIPKKEIDYIFNMPDDEFQALHLFAKKVALGVGAAISCKRVGVAVIGLEVAHAHIHLVPLNHVGDINFTQPKLIVSSDELSATATLIRMKIN